MDYIGAYMIALVILLIIVLVAKATAPEPKTKEDIIKDYFNKNIEAIGNKNADGIYENRLSILNDTVAILYRDEFTKQSSIKLDKIAGKITSMFNLYTINPDIQLISITFQFLSENMIISVFSKSMEDVSMGTIFYFLFDDSSVIECNYLKNPFQ